LWIAFPGPVRQVRLEVASTGPAVITAFAAGERVEFSPGVFEIFITANSFSDPTVEIEGKSIEWIKLSTLGVDTNIFLCRVCWVTEADVAAADYAATSAARQEDRFEIWSSEGDIL